MTRSNIEIHSPLAGLDRAWAVQSQPPFTCPDALNARCRDVFEQRARLGSRPGLVKAFAQNVSTQAATESFTKDFGASADTHIGGDISPIDVNYGGRTSFNVGRGSVVQLPGYAPERTLLHFNLNALPASATLTAATLRLYQVGWVNGTPAAMIYRIGVTGGGATPAWTELGSNWAKYNGVSTWVAAGGDFDLTTPAPIAWSIQAANGAFTINVLSHVQDAYTNRSKQLHMLLKLLDDLIVENEYGSFYSKEFTLYSDREPKLTVMYEVAT